jgi:WD40 repeat protein
MTHRRIAAAAALAVLLLGGGASAASAAGKGSILYVKKGKLWLASPSGKAKKRVRHKGRFINPSQADNGMIVAQRGVRLYSLTRRGRRLGKPISTLFRTNPVLPAFNGPFWPQVSPDGRTIAYTYSFTAEHFDYGCNCSVTTPSLNVAYTPTNRYEDDPVGRYGNARMYSRPSWIDNRHTLMTTPDLFNFAGDVLNTVALDTLGDGEDAYDSWFAECDPCDSLQTLRLQPLENGEMTRQQDKLAFVSGPLDSHEAGSLLALYSLPGGTSAVPGKPCTIGGASGKFDDPTWSPDGQSLAWADRRGIWVGRVNAIPAGGTCDVSRRLVVRGGRQPDWGPAGVRR